MARYPSDEGPLPAMPFPATQQQNPLGHLRILVVDDSPLAVDILLLVLKQLGIEATGVTNGAEALDILVRTAKDVPFDVVILDAELGEASGYELARNIINDAHLTTLPAFILCTGHDVETVRRLPSYDPSLVSAFLQKPVGIPVLREVLTTLLEGNDAGKAGQSLRSKEAPYDWLTAHSSIPGLCIDIGLDRAHGDIVTYRHRLYQFMQVQCGFAPALRQAILAGSFQDVYSNLQSLSDQAGVVGARVVEILAAYLGSMLQTACPLDALFQLVSRLEAAMQRLSAALRDDAAGTDAVAATGPEDS